MAGEPQEPGTPRTGSAHFREQLRAVDVEKWIVELRDDDERRQRRLRAKIRRRSFRIEAGIGAEVLRDSAAIWVIGAAIRFEPAADQNDTRDARSARPMDLRVIGPRSDVQRTGGASDEINTVRIAAEPFCILLQPGDDAAN